MSLNLVEYFVYRTERKLESEEEADKTNKQISKPVGRMVVGVSKHCRVLSNDDSR